MAVDRGQAAGAARKFHLRLKTDFFSQDGSMESVKVRPFDEGTSLQEALEELGITDCREQLIFEIDGDDSWNEKDLSEIRPTHGQDVMMLALPGGSDALRRRFTKILKVTAIAALMFYGAGYLVSTGVPAWIGSGIKYSAFAYAVKNYAQIFQSRKPGGGLADSEVGDSFLLSGAGNDLVPRGILTTPIGDIRFAPRALARPYQEIVGENEMWINLLVALGPAPVHIREPWLGNTPLSEYNQDLYQWRTALDGSGFDDYPNVSPNPLNVRVTEDWTTHYTEKDVDAIELALIFPGGLYGTNDQGYTDATVEYEIQYSPVMFDGNGDRFFNWRNFFKGSRTANKQRQILIPYEINDGIVEYTEVDNSIRSTARRPVQRYVLNPRYGDDGEPYKIWVTEYEEYEQVEARPPSYAAVMGNLEKGQYAVRVRRLTPEREDDSGTVDTLNWISLNSVFKGKVVHDDRIAQGWLRIKASDQATGDLPPLTVRGGVVMPKYDPRRGKWRSGDDGEFEGTSSNPGDILHYLMTSPRVNPSPFLPEEVDFDSLKELWQYATDSQFEYNRNIDFEADTHELLEEIAALARGLDPAPQWPLGNPDRQ